MTTPKMIIGGFSAYSRILDWAATMGPFTARLAESIMAERPHPEQGFRAWVASDEDRKTRIEHAYNLQVIHRNSRPCLDGAGKKTCSGLIGHRIDGERWGWAIDYADPASPVLAVRLQEMFGLAETPRLDYTAEAPHLFKTLSELNVATEASAIEQPIRTTRSSCSTARSPASSTSPMRSAT